MNRATIEAYINKLPMNEVYYSFPDEVQEKIIFGSWEMLRRRYGTEFITDELAGLQALYVAEGEREEYAKYHRHGLASMKVEDIVFSFKDNQGRISPEVLAIVEKAEADKATGNVLFGRLL